MGIAHGIYRHKPLIIVSTVRAVNYALMVCLDNAKIFVCGSKNLTKIERMNGYLSYSRVHGDTRLNEAKMAEIAERKSM